MIELEKLYLGKEVFCKSSEENQIEPEKATIEDLSMKRLFGCVECLDVGIKNIKSNSCYNIQLRFLYETEEDFYKDNVKHLEEKKKKLFSEIKNIDDNIEKMKKSIKPIAHKEKIDKLEAELEEKIVDNLLKTLDKLYIEKFKKIKKSDLILEHNNLGKYIRNRYDLWKIKWIPEIKDGIDFSNYHPDAISFRIIEKLWEKVNKTKNDVYS